MKTRQPYPPPGKGSVGENKTSPRSRGGRFARVTNEKLVPSNLAFTQEEQTMKNDRFCTRPFWTNSGRIRTAASARREKGANLSKKGATPKNAFRPVFKRLMMK